MKKRKISLCLFMSVSLGLFAAELKAKDVVKEAEKKEKECHCGGEHGGMPQGMEGMY